MLIAITLIVFVFAIAGDAYDVYMTEKGLKAGVGVESNTWLVGSKPSAEALILRDTLVFVLCWLPAVVAFLVHNIGFYYGALAGPVVYGIKHIMGGLSWKKLLK